jgi:hypothetical protein
MSIIRFLSIAVAFHFVIIPCLARQRNQEQLAESSSKTLLDCFSLWFNTKLMALAAATKE